MEQFGETIKDLMDDIFGIGVEAVAMQFLAVIVLLIVVRVFLWKNVDNFIQARKSVLESEVSETLKANEAAQKLLEERETQLDSAKSEARTIISNAKEQAKVEGSAIVDNANKQAAKRLENADAEVKLELEKAKEDIKTAIVDVAFVTAEKIIEREIDKSKHNDIVEKAIKEIK